jgi:hypothetical protein
MGFHAGQGRMGRRLWENLSGIFCFPTGWLKNWNLSYQQFVHNSVAMGDE